MIFFYEIYIFSLAFSIFFPFISFNVYTFNIYHIIYFCNTYTYNISTKRIIFLENKDTEMETKKKKKTSIVFFIVSNNLFNKTLYSIYVYSVLCISIYFLVFHCKKECGSIGTMTVYICITFRVTSLVSFQF